MEWYRVIGIVQTQVRGQWAERPTCTRVPASSPDDARHIALERARRDALAIDPYATARWHTPELVRASQIEKGSPA